MLYIAHYSKVSPRKSFIGYRPDPVSRKILIPAFSASLQKGSSHPYLPSSHPTLGSISGHLIISPGRDGMSLLNVDPDVGPAPDFAAEVLHLRLPLEVSTAFADAHSV